MNKEYSESHYYGVSSVVSIFGIVAQRQQGYADMHDIYFCILHRSNMYDVTIIFLLSSFLAVAWRVVESSSGGEEVTSRGGTAAVN